MSELINRDEAIEALKTVAGVGNRALDKLRSLPAAQPHWIPVTERLPEEDGLYLVTTSKGQVQMHVFSHYGNSEEYWMRCNKAWMPLPEPYKEGQDETD